MATEYMHIGIPVLDKEEGMTYNAGMKFWVSNVDDYNFKTEYLKFERGTPFPEALSKQLYMVCEVDSLELYVEQTQQVIFGPMDCGPGIRLAFVIWDDAIMELYEEK